MFLIFFKIFSNKMNPEIDEVTTCVVDEHVAFHCDKKKDFTDALVTTRLHALSRHVITVLFSETKKKREREKPNGLYHPSYSNRA